MHVVHQLGAKFPPGQYPDLLVGLAKTDDAAVYRLSDTQAIVQTLDFFAPLVDDPYEYGAIAAANAMSDIYAMGADVLFALNIAAFPEDLPIDIVSAILEGGADKVLEAGGAIAGGHTIYDPEPKYGLCVTGSVHPDHLLTNAAARPGDAILLTKRLGTGILLSAVHDYRADSEHERAAVEQMMTLNKAAAELARAAAPHAMADVTGFGLAGHLSEIAENSGVAASISLSALPALPGLAEGVAAGFSTAGQNHNRDYFSRRLRTPRDLTPLEDALLYDPQTSGGLLITLPPNAAERLQQQFTDSGIVSRRVGEIEPGSGLRITV